MSGNPVRIGDGYATVTGYKLPQPLVTSREGGNEVRPGVRIPIRLCSSGSALRDHFSVKEKDEASLFRGCEQDSLNAFILRFAGVKAFLFNDEVRSSML
jgi:hypothetical protein